MYINYTLLSHISEDFNVFLMKIAMFCFDQFCFLSEVGDMLEENVLGILDSDYLVNNINPPPPPPLPDIS